jgi:hypothetical protein
MRTLALAWTLVAMVIVLVAGCGGGTTTSSTSPDPDVNAAKEDMLLRTGSPTRHAFKA